MGDRAGEKGSSFKDYGKWYSQNHRPCLQLWQTIAGVIVLVTIIAVSVSVGVVVSRRSSNTRNSSSSSTLTNPGAVSQTNPNDPSTFVKNPNLHQAFYGIAYTPVGSQLPNCGNNLGMSPLLLSLVEIFMDSFQPLSSRISKLVLIWELFNSYADSLSRCSFFLN